MSVHHQIKNGILLKCILDYLYINTYIVKLYQQFKVFANFTTFVMYM